MIIIIQIYWFSIDLINTNKKLCYMYQSRDKNQNYGFERQAERGKGFLNGFLHFDCTLFEKPSKIDRIIIQP